VSLLLSHELDGFGREDNRVYALTSSAHEQECLETANLVVHAELLLGRLAGIRGAALWRELTTGAP
jgi:hypothetical protein